MTLRWTEYKDSRKACFEVEIFERQKYFFLPLHNHDYAEFFFFANGEGTHILNKRIQHVSKGDLIFIRPFDDFHCISESDENLVVIAVAIYWQSFKFIQDRYLSGSKLRALNQVKKLTPFQEVWFRSEANILRNEEKSKMEIERFILNVMHNFYKPDSYNERLAIPKWISNACVKIANQEYFSKGPKALFLLANHSPEYVTRELKKYIHLTATEVVNDARMKYAAEQLVYSEKQIIDIAYDCGLDSLSHFYRLFEDRYGVTPHRYRLSRRRL